MWIQLNSLDGSRIGESTYFVLFWLSSGGHGESKLDKKHKLSVCPVSAKIRVFQNLFNENCIAISTKCYRNFSFHICPNLTVLAQNEPSLVMTKKCRCLFREKSTTAKSQRLKVGMLQLDKCGGYRLCENFCWRFFFFFSFSSWRNLCSFSAKKLGFFCLIFVIFW